MHQRLLFQMDPLNLTTGDSPRPHIRLDEL